LPGRVSSTTVTGTSVGAATGGVLTGCAGGGAGGCGAGVTGGEGATGVTGVVGTGAGVGGRGVGAGTGVGGSGVGVGVAGLLGVGKRRPLPDAGLCRTGALPIDGGAMTRETVTRANVARRTGFPAVSGALRCGGATVGSAATGDTAGAAGGRGNDTTTVDG
jgi:hypothetical protein